MRAREHACVYACACASARVRVRVYACVRAIRSRSRVRVRLHAHSLYARESESLNAHTHTHTRSRVSSTRLCRRRLRTPSGPARLLTTPVARHRFFKARQWCTLLLASATVRIQMSSSEGSRGCSFHRVDKRRRICKGALRNKTAADVSCGLLSNYQRRVVPTPILHNTQSSLLLPPGMTDAHERVAPRRSRPDHLGCL